MDTREFLEKVLPQEGSYVLWLKKPSAGKKSLAWNENYDSFDTLTQAIADKDQTALDVYFAIGTFKDNIEVDPDTGRSRIRRLQKMAYKFKSLCCDIDVGGHHKYPHAKDAARELFSVCDGLNLPYPMLVASGRGVHAYWPMTDAVPARIWQIMSSCLLAALQTSGMDVDASKVKDPSMVLRPAGAHHKKDPANWREVRVVRDTPAVSPLELGKVLKPYRGAAVYQSPSKPSKKSTVMSAVLDEGDPVVLDSVRRGCKQIDALMATGGHYDAAGQEVQEPLWRASLGIAKFADDVEDAVVRLSGNHPGFDLDDNLRKLKGWKGTGPTLCSTFENLCPSGCEGCPHRGKITTPAHLTSGASEVVMTNPETQTSVQITLPRRYSVKNGALMYTPPGADEATFVSPYVMHVMARFMNMDENHQTIKILVKFPLEGERIIDMNVLDIANGGSEFLKALALRQVYISGDPRPLRQYLMTYLQELQKSSPMDLYYQHFGWQVNGTFLGSSGSIGNGEQDAGLVHYDGPIKDYEPSITTKGDLGVWKKLTKLFAQPKAKYHGLVFLMMAGSPLMAGSGLASTLVNSYSKESGSGKTITARMGLSIWGKPSKLMRTVNDTDNSLYKHFGVMHSLGAYIDEITTMDSERLRSFAFTLQEGRERDRVKQSADGFREKVSWMMPIFSSSNRDAYDVLGMRYSSEAEKLRVLQFNFDKLPIFDKPGVNVGYEMSKLLEENYGLAGPMIVEEIIKRGGASAVFDRAYRRFYDRYDFTFTGPERFYQAMMVLADAVGEIMSDLGLIHFDYRAAVRNGLQHILYLRETNIEGAMDGLDLCMQYLTENADKIVHWHEAPAPGGGHRGRVLSPTPKSACARSEALFDEHGKFVGGSMFINRSLFRRWCAVNGAEFRAVIAGLKKEGVGVKDNVRKTLFKGVQGASSSGQTYCFVLDMSTHARLIEASSTVESPMDVKPRLSQVE